MSTSAGKHLAAVITHKGGPLTVVERPTPTPGPKQILVEVRAFAINPVDYLQRETGMYVESYPAICGSDVAGIVVQRGTDVRPDAPATGARVVAFATACYSMGNPDYGAFQEYVLVSEDHIAILPDSFTFVEGSVFPMAAWTTWNGWLWAGIPRVMESYPVNEGLLIWGASSSMGTLAV